MTDLKQKLDLERDRFREKCCSVSDNEWWCKSAWDAAVESVLRVLREEGMKEIDPLVIPIEERDFVPADETLPVIAALKLRVQELEDIQNHQALDLKTFAEENQRLRKALEKISQYVSLMGDGPSHPTIEAQIARAALGES